LHLKVNTAHAFITSHGTFLASIRHSITTHNDSQIIDYNLIPTAEIEQLDKE